MIPDEAVEAAAQCLYERDLGVDWGGLRPSVKRGYLDDARGALEAAAPHLLAAAWDEGYDRSELDHSETGFWTTRLRTNPYRKRPDV